MHCILTITEAREKKMLRKYIGRENTLTVFTEKKSVYK